MKSLLYARLQTLTARELAAYQHIRAGLPTAKIAYEMRIAWSTAKTYRKRINRKLGSQWRTLLSHSCYKTH